MVKEFYQHCQKPNEKNTLIILLLTGLFNFAADVLFLTVKRKKVKKLKKKTFNCCVTHFIFRET